MDPSHASDVKFPPDDNETVLREAQSNVEFSPDVGKTEVQEEPRAAQDDDASDHFHDTQGKESMEMSAAELASDALPNPNSTEGVPKENKMVAITPHNSMGESMAELAQKLKNMQKKQAEMAKELAAVNGEDLNATQGHWKSH